MLGCYSARHAASQAGSARFSPLFSTSKTHKEPNNLVFIVKSPWKRWPGDYFKRLCLGSRFIKVPLKTARRVALFKTQKFNATFSVMLLPVPFFLSSRYRFTHNGSVLPDGGSCWLVIY